MRKHLKGFSAVCALVLVLSCLLVPMSAVSAAYITDGTNFYKAGDVNDDGTIDICDLVAANRSFGADETSSQWSSATDLDGSSEIGSYDLALIRAMILGIDKSQWTE